MVEWGESPPCLDITAGGLHAQAPKHRTAMRQSRVHPSRTEISSKTETFSMIETQTFTLDQRAVPNVHNLTFIARKRLRDSHPLRSNFGWLSRV